MDEILSTVTIIDGVAGLVGPVCDNILPFGLGPNCLVISDIYNNFFY